MEIKGVELPMGGTPVDERDASDGGNLTPDEKCVAMVGLNSRGKIVSLDEAAEKILGCKSEEAMGCSALVGPREDLSDGESTEPFLNEHGRQAEERCRALVAAMTSIIWESNAAGEFVVRQESWESFTGQTWDEYRGRGWLKALHPLDLSRLSKAWINGLRNRRTEIYEARLWHAPTKEYRYIVTRAVPMMNADGSVSEWVGTITDIHDRKCAEERSKFMLALNDRIRASDTADEILYAVVRALGEQLRLSRCAYGQIDTENGLCIIHDDYAKDVPSITGQRPLGETRPDLLASLRAGEVMVIEDVRLDPRTADAPESNFRPADVRSMIVIPVTKGGALQGLFTLQDLNVRMWTQQELHLATEAADRAWFAIQALQNALAIKQLNADLERRVAARTAELEAANREMEGFTYTVSHDLRGPLRAIMSSSMILMEDYGDRVEGEERRLLERQASAAKKLGQIIDDVLKLSRLGRAEIHKTTFNLSVLAQEVATEIGGQDAEQRLVLQVDEELTAVGDPQLMKLALQNLLENSLKFAKPATVAHVRLERRIENNRELFTVADDGIGFDQQYVEKIFVPFERLHRDEEYPGTGIGLANVKRIVERHGGKIWAEGHPGVGATFYFTL